MINTLISSSLGSLVKFLWENNAIFLSEIIASLLASLKIREVVVVKWDGEDWSYKWRNGGIITSTFDYNPKNINSDIDLFFDYTPKSGDTIIDIGVENGTEIPSFCACVGHSGRVYAIEADPACCRRLHKLKELLSLQNLIIIHAAVGASDGYAIFSQDLNSLSNHLVGDDYDGETIKVKISTLPSLMNEYNVKAIDYVKINIEGAEVELLKGLTDSDLLVDHICLSCHDFIGPAFRTYDFCKKWLYDAGYITVKNYFPPSKPWRNYYLYASRG